EDRPADRTDAAGRKDLVRPASRGRDRARGLALDQDDRRPVERNELAQLVDERVERPLDLERGSECAGAAVRGFEHVGAAAELVAQPVRLGGPRLGGETLEREPVPKAADDDAGEQADEAAYEDRPPAQPRSECG